MPQANLDPIDAPLYDPRREHDACGVGFVADLDGSHRGRTVAMALEALAALVHRGARAADDRTGDGAGISIPLSGRFRHRILADAGGTTARRRRVAVGMCFLPPAEVDRSMRLVERSVVEAGLQVEGWRRVPVRSALLRGRRVAGTPAIWQVIVAGDRRLSPLPFARRLSIVRRSAEAAASNTADLGAFAMPSLSTRTIVYKGLFIGDELGRFYEDLGSDDLDASYAIFHQRYSTNTFPSWRLAQPFGYLAHNGEINTVRANREAMRGRRNDLGRAAWVRRLADIGPLVSAAGSDSQALDDALELLLLAGIPIDRALRELIPAAAGLGGTGAAARPARAEPWDGPAAIAFGDGQRVGCLLDRNGLRPLAMTTTHDGLVIVSSEAGSVALTPDRVTSRRRLGPGEMVVVDLARRTVHGPTPDDAANERPMSLTGFRSISRPPTAHGPMSADAPRSDMRLRLALGLDAEIVRQLVRPMALEAHEATWSMGDDTPLASLSARPRRVTDFLRQAFAQVTNPPIDPIRERVVMSVAVAVGPQPLMLGTSSRQPIALDGPVLARDELVGLVADFDRERVVTLDATWPASRGARGLRFGLARLARQANSALRRGAHLIVLTDRAVSDRRIAIPAVLATGCVHQELTTAGRRSRCDLVVEFGGCFDVHDVAMLIASGASAVHPWLLLELSAEQAATRGAEHLEPADARRNSIAALEAGLRKVLARMGISALASYRGGQVFDVIGLDADVVARCFPAAGHWPGRIGLDDIGQAVANRHRHAFQVDVPSLPDPGLVRFRGSGESHAFAPTVVKALRTMVEPGAGLGDVRTYLATVADGGPRQPRDLLAFRPTNNSLPIDDVEPASRIVRRFVSSAMSLGALSPEAHQAISIGMHRLGASANSGEGGEDPAWYAPTPGGDRRDAAIKQVASARFGVTTEYLARAEQLEIKIAQGSKPGEGGQLPGKKVTGFIAALRRGQPGMTLISPPPHHDIYSIEDLAQLISDLRAVNPTARIGVKLVAGAGIGTIAAGVAKAQADYIMVSGHAGGTGASPLSSIKHAGLPWELGLAEVHQVLVRNRLRDRVALRTDGGLQTGRDVVVAAMLGAEEFGFGTAALVAIGCAMARQCHLDTCPTGIATQREDLRAKFAGRPEDVVSFFMAIANDVRRELAALGLASLGEAVGRTDLLDATITTSLDLSPILATPPWAPRNPRSAPRDRIPAVDRARPSGSASNAGFEADLLADLLERIDAGQAVTVNRRVSTRDRTIGARLAGALARRPEPRRLPHVRYELAGSAGQSLGAFVVPGMCITLTGEANDYVGKGLSGGTIVIRPPRGNPDGETETLAGNVCLFGATAGTLHVVGRAGMRFAVRNSGARAVVEGIGAHGCEYMTGGTVVILGSVGPNFGAGMTGGTAIVLAEDALEGRLNAESVTTRPLGPGEVTELRALLVAHAGEGSRRAAAFLAAWDPDRFVVVEPCRVTEVSLQEPVMDREAAAR